LQRAIEDLDAGDETTYSEMLAAWRALDLIREAVEQLAPPRSVTRASSSARIR
jgi:hypothetical protein